MTVGVDLLVYMLSCVVCLLFTVFMGMVFCWFVCIDFSPCWFWSIVFAFGCFAVCFADLLTVN